MANKTRRLSIYRFKAKCVPYSLHITRKGRRERRDGGALPRTTHQCLAPTAGVCSKDRNEDPDRVVQSLLACSHVRAQTSLHDLGARWVQLIWTLGALFWLKSKQVSFRKWSWRFLNDNSDKNKAWKRSWQAFIGYVNHIIMCPRGSPRNPHNN